MDVKQLTKGLMQQEKLLKAEPDFESRPELVKKATAKDDDPAFTQLMSTFESVMHQTEIGRRMKQEFMSVPSHKRFDAIARSNHMVEFIGIMEKMSSGEHVVAEETGPRCDDISLEDASTCTAQETTEGRSPVLGSRIAKALKQREQKKRGGEK
ncbi:hypothetical protein LTR66_015116, partial [Elasticomyces elasticus]